MTLLDLGQVVPCLFWPQIREISTCFLLGTANQMDIEVLGYRKQGWGTRVLDPMTEQRGKEGPGGDMNLLQDRRQPTAFQPQDGSRGESFPPALPGSRELSSCWKIEPYSCLCSHLWTGGGELIWGVGGTYPLQTLEKAELLGTFFFFFPEHIS